MVLVIGHRGAKALAPENTLEGLRVAARCGADLAEVDVRLSKDGVLVLMHDEAVNRTTNGSGRVQDLSREDLSALSVLSVLSVSGVSVQKIPTLEEAISLAKELSLGLVVEMKEEGLEELVTDCLKGSDSMVTSFYHASLREIKELSNLRTGIIISSLPVRPVELALWAGADAIFPRRYSPRLFKEAHRRGLKVFPWTINESEEAAWLLRLGADGLVTDDPCLIRNVAEAPLKATGKGNCEYYPCHHFQDQDCTHCFCPLYPCRDRDLGRFVRTGRGKRVWTCIDCRLVHTPSAAKYLLENPDATTEELKALEGRM
jgi:glycerophosphoryl diester phosphodiesterase